MRKRLVCVILAAIMCIMMAVPAFAATITTTYIESTSITLTYNDFMAGSSDDDGNVTVTLNGANGLYSVDNTSMDVPKNGWAVGDVPDFRITLVVSNEDTTKFAYSASRPSGVCVDGGEAHYGELRSNSKRVYYEIHLREVQENEDEKWNDEKDWNQTDPSLGGPGSGGPGSQGAWLKDPNNGRYWYSKADGTRYINQWAQIYNIWYFFDATGFRVENQWIKWNGKDYYLGENGRMYSNERTPDGYWVNKDGSWDGKPKSK